MKSNDKNTQSKTFGAKKIRRFTDRLNIRCDPETKKAIIEFSENTGISICQLYDALTKAFLHGCQLQRDLGTQSPTINLTIERQVQRVRRYARESGAGDGRVEEVEEPSGFVPCALSGCGCRNPAVLELRKEGVGRVHACPSHVEYFKERHFVEWTRVVEGGLGGDWRA